MPEPAVIGHQVNFGKGLVGLIKQGFWEIPAVMCASVLGLIGLGLGTYGLYRAEKENLENKEYKSVYMIMRPEDSRVKMLKNPVRSKY